MRSAADFETPNNGATCCNVKFTQGYQDDPVQVWTKGAAVAMPILYVPDIHAWSATSVSDKPREFGRFARKFNALTASALPPEDTPAFLQQLTREIT